MREITIGKNDAGQRLDRFLGKAMPLLPSPSTSRRPWWTRPMTIWRAAICPRPS